MVFAIIIKLFRIKTIISEVKNQEKIADISSTILIKQNVKKHVEKYNHKMNKLFICTKVCT